MYISNTMIILLIRNKWRVVIMNIQDIEMSLLSKSMKRLDDKKKIKDSVRLQE